MGRSRKPETMVRFFRLPVHLNKKFIRALGVVQAHEGVPHSLAEVCIDGIKEYIKDVEEVFGPLPDDNHDEEEQ